MQSGDDYWLLILQMSFSFHKYIQNNIVLQFEKYSTLKHIKSAEEIIDVYESSRMRV